MTAPTGIDLAAVANALLPLGAVVIAAAISIIVATRRKPEELATDNDRLRSRVDSLTTKYDTLDQAHRDLKDKVDRELRVVGRGFDALVRLVDRMIAHWGDGVIPTLDAVDQADVTAAQKLREQP